jgi:hypothetical protein
MAGIGDPVKVFLVTWDKRKTREIPDPEEARCVVCGTVLEDGNFIMLDGDLLCPRCRRKERGYVKHNLGKIGIWSASLL